MKTVPAWRESVPVRRAGKDTESVYVGRWKWEDDNGGPISKMMEQAQKLHHEASNHDSRQQRRSVQRGENVRPDWRDRIEGPGAALKREAASLRRTAVTAHRAGNVASEAMEQAHNARSGLRPFDLAVLQVSDGATTRASIREGFARMAPKDQEAFLQRDNLGDQVVAALCEMGDIQPELIGLHSQRYQSFVDRNMERRHGDKLKTYQAQIDAADYVIKLASAVEQGISAELAEYGMHDGEAQEFIREAAANG